MKVLNPKVHGVLDYALAIAFLVMPGLLNFSDTAATLSYIIGAVYIVASLITRYPLGAFKLLPFPVHGVLETIMAIGWIVAPLIFGFADETAARNWFIIAGIGLLAVVAFTDYKAAELHAGYAGDDRRQGFSDRRRRSMAVTRERRMGLSDRRAGAF